MRRSLSDPSFLQKRAADNKSSAYGTDMDALTFGKIASLVVEYNILCLGTIILLSHLTF